MSAETDLCLDALRECAPIFIGTPAALSDDAARLALLPLLDGDERARHERIVKAEDKHLFLCSHGWMRTVLAGYLGGAPADVRFSFGPHGRPELSPTTDLRFNLSHTDGLVALIVTAEKDCGVDVERPGRVRRPLELADRFFASFEIAALRALPESQQGERFYALWTLKESYIKARGLGLAHSLKSFGFSFEECRPRLQFVGDSTGVDSSRWSVTHQILASGHHLAAAVAESSLPLDLRPMPPLDSPEHQPRL